MNRESGKKELPVGRYKGTVNGVQLSQWSHLSRILRYVEDDATYKLIDFNGKTAESQAKFQQPKILICPSDSEDRMNYGPALEYHASQRRRLCYSWETT